MSIVANCNCYDEKKTTNVNVDCTQIQPVILESLKIKSTCTKDNVGLWRIWFVMVLEKVC